jgi:N-methylhydantoinase B
MSVELSVDPITFEILSHRLYQITKEMGSTLERVGGTVNTTQMKDYLAALYRPNGDVLCAGDAMPWHVGCAGVAVRRIIERFAADNELFPDDMFLINDPYLAAIHQSDVYTVSPIHVEDRLIGWSATFVHVADIGAMSPGGNSPEAREICHEGVRIGGIKLIERGKLRRDVFDTITNMTRQPIMVGLDFKCEIAANNVGRARLQEMYRHYGLDLMDRVTEEMIRHTESVLRRRIAEIPDGRWQAEGAIEAGESWNMKVVLEKRGDHLVFDFTGSAQQAKVGINLPYHATVGACFESVLCTFGYDLPKNHGLFRVITVVAPEGTVVNPTYPAPVSLNTTSGGAVARYLAGNVLHQMIGTSEKWASEVTAQNLGTRLARHAGVNQAGRYYVSTIVGLGGVGGRSWGDGIESAGIEMGQTSTVHNVEWVEDNFPLMYLFRRHITDGAGPGKFRGGAGEESLMMLHDAPDKKIQVVAFGVAGFRNSGHGTCGGYPGAPAILAHIEDSEIRKVLAEDKLPDELEPLKGRKNLLDYRTFELHADDLLFLRCANGGGYGDPLERESKSVLNDVVNGLVSRDAAADIYGVVIGEDHQVDLSGTDRKRAFLKQERQSKARLTGGISIPSSRLRDTKNIGKKDTGVRNPLQEYLEVWKEGEESWIRCVSCGHVLCEAGRDWIDACSSAVFPPTKAGPLMEILRGKFVFKQWHCPSCGVSLKVGMVDEPNGASAEGS